MLSFSKSILHAACNFGKKVLTHLHNGIKVDEVRGLLPFCSCKIGRLYYFLGPAMDAPGIISTQLAHLKEKKHQKVSYNSLLGCFPIERSVGANCLKFAHRAQDHLLVYLLRFELGSLKFFLTLLSIILGYADRGMSRNGSYWFYQIRGLRQGLREWKEKKVEEEHLFRP